MRRRTPRSNRAARGRAGPKGNTGNARSGSTRRRCARRTRRTSRDGEHQVQRPEAARRLSEHRASAFLGEGPVAGVDVTDHVAHDVGRVGAVVDRVDVLRSAESRETVDEDDDRGRHRPGRDQPVRPLHDVALPGPAREERCGISGVPVQAIEDRKAAGPRGIVAGRRVHGERPRRGIAERVFPQRVALEGEDANAAREPEQRPKRPVLALAARGSAPCPENAPA